MKPLQLGSCYINYSMNIINKEAIIPLITPENTVNNGITGAYTECRCEGVDGV